MLSPFNTDISLSVNQNMKLFSSLLKICAFLLWFIVRTESTLDITISARYRKLQCYWSDLDVDDHQTGRYIIVTRNRVTDTFNKNFNEGSDPDPMRLNSTWKVKSMTDNVLFDYKINESSGWITTNITFDSSVLKDVNSNTSCYGYWISYVNGSGNVLSWDCMRAHPRWMSEIRDEIGDLQLRDIIIPGSHDSGSYHDNYNLDEYDITLDKYFVTQEDDIRSQLLHGCRYLDIRVAYYEYLTPQFWVNHGVFLMQHLDHVLKQTSDFVRETGEIVIFDIQEFPVGFGNDLQIHKKLVEYIESRLGDVIVRNRNWSSKISSIDRGVIVGYDDERVVGLHPTILFQSVRQRWGDVRTLSDLRKYLERIAKETSVKVSSRPISAMAELTPDVAGIILDLYKGLRVMADQVNQNVSLWYDREWRNVTNVVSVDFYRGTTIVRTAIDHNKSLN